MGFSTNSSSARSTTLADINITPLCDVLLVLLIIFMVTAPLMTQGIDVQLPQAKAPAIEQAKDHYTVTLRKEADGFRLFLGNDAQPVGIAALEQHLKQAMADREEKDLYLRADRDIRYGDVAKVMAIAKLAGITRIGMMTQPEGQ